MVVTGARRMLGAQTRVRVRRGRSLRVVSKKCTPEEGSAWWRWWACSGYPSTHSVLQRLSSNKRDREITSIIPIIVTLPESRYPYALRVARSPRFPKTTAGSPARRATLPCSAIWLFTG